VEALIGVADLFAVAAASVARAFAADLLLLLPLPVAIDNATAWLLFTFLDCPL